MKFAIVVAGAIGGYGGQELALAGEKVTFMIRGANLDAIRSNGIKPVMHDGVEHVARHVASSNDHAATGPQRRRTSTRSARMVLLAASVAAEGCA